MADVILVPEGEQAAASTCFWRRIATSRCRRPRWCRRAVVETEKGPPHFGTSGWLAHIDMPSLIVSSLQPCEPGEGSNRAVAARFVETAGFGGSAELRFARDPVRASLADGEGNALQPLTILGDAVQLEYSAGETLRVKLEWE